MFLEPDPHAKQRALSALTEYEEPLIRFYRAELKREETLCSTLRRAFRQS